MLSIELNDSFAAYLRQSISQSALDKMRDFAKGVKDRGFFSQITTQVLGDGGAGARELLFNQKQLLKVAEQYLHEKPWIAYFAAAKHILFLRSKGITTVTFKEFRDKEYADEVSRHAETIALAAEKLLDSETQNFLHELIMLQQVEPFIEQAAIGLGDLLKIPINERHDFLHPERDDRSRRKPFEDGGRDVRKIQFGISQAAIASAAKGLGQNPEDWVLCPQETIAYLMQLKERRLILEDTYLQLL